MSNNTESFVEMGHMGLQHIKVKVFFLSKNFQHSNPCLGFVIFQCKIHTIPLFFLGIFIVRVEHYRYDHGSGRNQKYGKYAILQFVSTRDNAPGLHREGGNPCLLLT